MSARLLAQARSAMTTDVIETAECSLAIARDDQTFPGACRAGALRRQNFPDKKIPCPLDLALVSDQHPLSGKNGFLFLGEDFRRNKVTLRQRGCPLGKALRSLAEGRCGCCRHVGQSSSVSCAPAPSRAEEMGCLLKEATPRPRRPGMKR